MAYDTDDNTLGQYVWDAELDYNLCVYEKLIVPINHRIVETVLAKILLGMSFRPVDTPHATVWLSLPSGNPATASTGEASPAENLGKSERAVILHNAANFAPRQPSPMRAVLETTELLENIFDYVPDAENKLRPLCRQWKSLLDHLLQNSHRWRSRCWLDCGTPVDRSWDRPVACDCTPAKPCVICA